MIAKTLRFLLLGLSSTLLLSGCATLLEDDEYYGYDRYDRPSGYGGNWDPSYERGDRKQWNNSDQRHRYYRDGDRRTGRDARDPREARRQWNDGDRDGRQDGWDSRNRGENQGRWEGKDAHDARPLQPARPGSLGRVVRPVLPDEPMRAVRPPESIETPPQLQPSPPPVREQWRAKAVDELQDEVVIPMRKVSP